MCAILAWIHRIFWCKICAPFIFISYCKDSSLYRKWNFYAFFSPANVLGIYFLFFHDSHRHSFPLVSFTFEAYFRDPIWLFRKNMKISPMTLFIFSLCRFHPPKKRSEEIEMFCWFRKNSYLIYLYIYIESIFNGFKKQQWI